MVSQFVTVTGTINSLPGCSDTDSIWLEIVDPTMDVVALGNTDFCQGESVQLQAINNVDNTNLEWTPDTGLNSTTNEIVTASPNAGSVIYTATVRLEGCSASDSILVNVDPFDFPIITTTDTLICQGQSVDLASDFPFTTTIYEWTPDIAISPSNTVSGPVVTPEQTTTYNLIATSASGFCSDMASVNIEVIPAAIDIMPDDTIYVCKGDPAVITATTTTGMIEWFPTEGLSDSTTLTVTANVDVSQWYFATMTVGACTILDSIYVRVDSLPMMPIQALPPNPPYCPGEVITLVSPVYDPVLYPDIMHQWTPGIGVTSDLNNYNLVLGAVETLTYVRTTINNACSQQDQILIDVVDPTSLDLTWTDTTICQGEPLMNEILEGTEPEWSPGTGLSCTECASTMITTQQSIVYTARANIMGCPAEQQATVNIIPDPTASLIEDTEICLGDFQVLNTQVFPGATYTWTANPADPNLDPNAAQPNVSPSQTTTYSVTVMNGDCNPFESEVTIIVIDNPVISIDGDFTICEGEEVTLNAYPQELSGFQWRENGDLVGSNSSISVTPNSSTAYDLSYTDDCGNTFNGTINVTVIEEVNLDIIADASTTDSLPQGTRIELEVNPSGPINGGTYQWSNGFSGEMITHVALNIPRDTITLSITSDEGCTYENTIIFIVKEVEFDVPNAFTPNGDGFSDYFNASFSPNAQILDFKIWSRWGAQVYNNEDPINGWDGRKDDKDMPSDVYMFYIRYRTPAGIENDVHGDMTLIR